MIAPGTVPLPDDLERYLAAAQSALPAHAPLSALPSDTVDSARQVPLARAPTSPSRIKAVETPSPANPLDRRSVADAAAGVVTEHLPSVRQLRTRDRLTLSRALITELRRRGVLRTGNAPAGDYAEFLVQQAVGGELAPNSQKGWDVMTSSGERLQVKARVVTDATVHGERQLSVFRSWDFDAGLIVLFDDAFRVWQGARVPVATLRDRARFVAHVSGYRIFATDELLAAGENWTERLRAAAG